MYQVEGTVPSVVLDAGSHTLKAGHAGEDLPRVLIPSVVSGTGTAGHDVCTRRCDGVELLTPFSDDGLVDNWDRFEALLRHTFSNELCVRPDEYAVLCAEPNHNGRAARERLVEILFEKFNVPAAYLARSAVLSAYANGRTTGLVLDIGYSGTSAVPVEDGAIVKNKFLRTAVGARAINDSLRKQLVAADVRLRPLWSVARSPAAGSLSDDEPGSTPDYVVTDLSFPATTASFTSHSVNEVLEQVKAGLCRALDNPGIDLSSVAIPSSTYELPDGNVIEFGAEKFAAAEQTVFGTLVHVSTAATTERKLSYVNQLLNGAGENGASGPGASKGLHGLVFDAIRMCEQSTHRDMYAGVCLTGGTSDMGGLFERLSHGLMEMYHKVRVLAAAGSNERKYCAWTGGSILGTFADFQKMWFSASEYEENGASFVHRKCQ